MLLYPFYVLQTKLCLDNFHVTNGIDLSFDVNDFRVVEGTYDLEDTIDSADVRQESIA